ncbi:FadR/GntR family transcriptional regulator [Roseomonas elaeocarpi]|uniref:FadR/GntR family transcriptional regulator n=1 Tax=Roseomonas elaeocarpi TaxID=907779 RepID=A0ABV6JP93_9PROT
MRDLLQQIDEGHLRPGDQLPTERELCVRYGVSRTVVREAVSSLRASGRLAVEQGRGAFVLSPAATAPRYHLQPSEAGAVEDVLKLMEVRIALESEAASLAAQRGTAEGKEHLAALTRRLGESAADAEASAALDRDFHMCVAALSGNSYFGTLLGGLSPQLVPRARLDLFKHDAAARADYLTKLQMEHTHILDAVMRSDAEGARAAMRLHLSNSRERLRAALHEIGGARS